MRLMTAMLTLALILATSAVQAQGLATQGLATQGLATQGLAKSPQPTLAPKRASSGEGSLTSQVTPTAEMWFYDQELKQRYSPQLAVRRKAEFETAQRMRRMASREWFGISLSRPQANPTPVTGSYAPTWTSGGRDSNLWSGQQSGSSVQVVVPGTRPTYTIY